MRSSFFIFAFILLVVSCSENSVTGKGNGQYSDMSVDSLLVLLSGDRYNAGLNAELLNKCTETGDMETIINTQPEFFRNAALTGNTEAMVNSGIFLAQAFLFKDELDSAVFYLDRVFPYVSNDSVSFMSVMARNVSAIYAMKSYNGYTEALDNFKKAYQTAESLGDTKAMGIMLLNITLIYIGREDTSGLEYASMAVDLAEETEDEYLYLYSYMNMADMQRLMKNYENALQYAGKAMEKIDKASRRSLLSAVYIIMADCYSEMGDFRTAERYFRKAGEYLQYAESGINTRYAVDYGYYLSSAGRYAEAVSVLSWGDTLAECTDIDRIKLYGLLSDVYFKCGKESLSLDYYKRLHSISDSLSVMSEERAFNRLLIYYKMTEYEKALGEKEIQLARSRRDAAVATSAMLMVLVISCCVFILYRRKRAMYRQLVDQYKSYKAREQQKKENADAAEDSKNWQLWLRIRHLMDEEKAYRSNSLSIDGLSEQLGSNRTYVSKVINKYSGLTFFNYINQKRIEEATSVLSDPDNDIPLKALADSLGYNSLSTFYKAFQKDTGCPPSKFREEMRRKK